MMLIHGDRALWLRIQRAAAELLARPALALSLPAQVVQEQRPHCGLVVVPPPEPVQERAVDLRIPVEGAGDLPRDGAVAVGVSVHVDRLHHRLVEGRRVVDGPERDRQPVDGVGAEVVGADRVPVVHEATSPQGRLHAQLLAPPVPAALLRAPRRGGQQAPHLVVTGAALALEPRLHDVLLDRAVQEAPRVRLVVHRPRDCASDQVREDGARLTRVDARVRRPRRQAGYPVQLSGGRGAEEDRYRRQPHQAPVARVLAGRLVHVWHAGDPAELVALQPGQLRQGASHVAPQADGPLGGALLVPAEGVVVTAKPPAPEANPHVAPVVRPSHDERVRHAQAHGRVVGPLATLKPELVELAVELLRLQVEERSAWIVRRGDELERVAEGVADGHSADGSHGPAENLVAEGALHEAGLGPRVQALQDAVVHHVRVALLGHAVLHVHLLAVPAEVDAVEHGLQPRQRRLLRGGHLCEQLRVRAWGLVYALIILAA
mmetsp:Transcript_69370/g.186010  ORF Transcript_69370/g.186010 Transcript_69370/m.186010 type:complete len:490 (+) Transcript_69370:96-1565(+)